MTATGAGQIFEISPGALFAPGWLKRAAQMALVADLRAIIAEAPLFLPRMPRSGAPLSVKMTNCGALGWVTDADCGYRYQAKHPVTGAPWPAISEGALDVWRDVGGWPVDPEACLVNWYGSDARMGLHQDRDEQDLVAPVVSISLGDDAVFRLGGDSRKAPTRSFRLASGDVLALTGPARLAFHGVDRIVPNSSTLLEEGGRFNLTLRRVTPLPESAPPPRP